jgi:hypothetical protein
MELDLNSIDLETLEVHLAVAVAVKQLVHPTVEIGDWYVRYIPDSYHRDCNGKVLHWEARQASRMYHCDTLQHLIEVLKREEA